MDSKKVIMLIQADGWYEVAQKGSHKQFKHPNKSGRVTVKANQKDIPIKTLKSIAQQSGVSLR